MSQSVILTIIGSLILIVTGIGFYIGTGADSITALIPAFLGVPLFICALASMKPAATKIAMHIAVLLALAGALGSTRVFAKWSDLPVTARSAQLITFTICVILIIVFVRSFIAARKARKTE